MSTVAEVVSYWRLLVQEPDNSFVEDAQATQLLKFSYREFRATVSRYDPGFYAHAVAISPSGFSYDLATGPVSVMGPTPTDPRLSRLTSIEDNDGGNVGRVWRGVTSRRALLSGGETNTPLYMLSGSKLHFETALSTPSLLLTYIPVESVDWTQLTVATFIDELVDYHDLIALYAARRYYAIDASQNRSFLAEIQSREAGLEDYLSSARSGDSLSIQREDSYGGW